MGAQPRRSSFGFGFGFGVTALADISARASSDIALLISEVLGERAAPGASSETNIGERIIPSARTC
jgi:hypothetical protein